MSARARRRRRRNPAGDWITLRAAAGAVAGALVPLAISFARERCDDGTPSGLSDCGDATDLVVLAAPLAVGVLSQGGRLEPGRFRSGIAIGGAVLGALALYAAARGEGPIGKLFARFREPPRVPADVVVT